MSDWEETQRELRMIVLRRGDRTVEQVASLIPASRAQVYRMMSGEVRRPSLAMRKSVERLVSQVRRPNATGSED